MNKQLLVRNVRPEICTWIDAQRAQHNMSQQEFVLSFLDQAVESDLELKLPLFADRPDGYRKVHTGDTSVYIHRSFRRNWRLQKLIAETRAGAACFPPNGISIRKRRTKPGTAISPRRHSQNQTCGHPESRRAGGGLPCQPFSIAGVSKRQSLGIAHGFKCVTQGNLFFQLATIVKAKRPPVLFLENVKNLPRSHDQGRTWAVIREALDGSLNYWIFDQVIDAADYVPVQHRERVYISLLR